MVTLPPWVVQTRAISVNGMCSCFACGSIADGSGIWSRANDFGPDGTKRQGAILWLDDIMVHACGSLEQAWAPSEEEITATREGLRRLVGQR